MSDNKPILKDLLLFYRNPSIEAKKNLTALQTLWNIFRLWGFEIVISIGLGILLTVVLSSVHYDTNNNEIINLLQTGNVWYLVFAGIIYAPIVEEIIFRLGLKFSPFRLGFSLAFVLYFGLQLLDVYNIVHISNSLVNLGIENNLLQLAIQLLFAIALGIGFSFVFKIKNINAFLNKWFVYFFPTLFYVSALLFGISHATNYSEVKEIWFLIPILGLPQIFIGLVLGYARIKYGIKWSMFLHALHNTVAFIPAVLLSFGSNQLKALLFNNTGANQNNLNNLSTSDTAIILVVVTYVATMLIACLFVWIQMILEITQERK